MERLGCVTVLLLSCVACAAAAAPAQAPTPPAATPPTGEDESNAATWYRRAHELQRGIGEADQEFLETQLADPSQWRPWDPTWAARAESVLAQVGPSIDALARGGAADHCDFGGDRSAGFAMTLPHLGDQRRSARMLAAAAQWAMHRGRSGDAARLMGLQLDLARDLAGDRVMISSLVGAAISGLSATTARDALDLGVIDPQQAAGLAEAFEAMADPAALGCADAMRGEMELMRASLTDAKSARELVGELEPQTPIEIADDESVRKDLESMESMYLKAASAFEEPDPAKARALLDGLSEELSQLPEGSLARILMPSWESMWNTMQRSRTELLGLAADFRGIADGSIAASDLTDAMAWYVQAGRALNAIPQDDQVALELLRAVGHAEDLRRTMRPMDQLGRVLDPTMQRGWAAKLCLVAGRDRARPTMAIDHVALARGAARAMVLRAMHDRAQDLPAALFGVCTMIEQARDARCLAGALLASLLVDDLAESLPQACTDGRIDAATRTALRQRLTAIGARGVLLDEALAGELDTIVARWAPPRPVPGLADARRVAGRTLGPNGVAFVLAVMAPTVTRESDQLPEGELVGDGGMAIEALQRLADQREAVGATPFVSGKDVAVVQATAPLGSVTPSVPIDLESMAASWSDRVQALIAAVGE